MKKQMTAILSAALIGAAISGCSATQSIPGASKNGAAPQAADNRIYSFSRVFMTGGNTAITSEYALNNGGVRFVSDQYKLTSLPDAVESKGELYNFTIYGNRIYFLTCDGGSDILPGQIYSCNTDGSDMKLIAEDASNYSTCFIYKGQLYYDVYPKSEYVYLDTDDSITYDSGIWRISLDGREREKLVDMKNVCLTYMDKEHLYYTVPGGDSSYYCDLDGKNEEMIFGTDERTGFYADYSYKVDCNSDTVYRVRDSRISVAEINGRDEAPVVEEKLDSKKREAIALFGAEKDVVIYAVFYTEGMNNYARLCGVKR